MIKVTNELVILKIGEKTEPVGGKKLIIHSHWNDNDLIDIELPGFDKITVGAKDLEAAISNAKNSSRF